MPGKNSTINDGKISDTVASEKINNSKNTNENLEKHSTKKIFTEKDIELLYKEAIAKKIVIKNKEFFAVTEKKKPFYISDDFDNDGIIEFYVLFFEGSSPEDVEKTYETDMRNIYNEEYYERQYILAVYNFDESENRFLHKKNVMLEGCGAFSSFKKIEIDKKNKIFALSVNFQINIGVQENIVVNRNNTYSITSVKNTLSDTMRKDDIDNNGIIDLLRYEKVFVDGSGAETFITWYKFNGRIFEPVKTVNTVKDLILFIENAKSCLNEKNVNLFIKNNISPAAFKRLSSAKIGSYKILQKIFYPAKRESSFLIDIESLLSSGDSANFVFPEILENPFRLEDDNLYSFTAYVKVVVNGGGVEIKDIKANNAIVFVNEEIYLVRIYMSHNPFDKQRFFFFVN